MANTAQQRTEVVHSAVITRADGRVENLGVISATYKSPLKQWWWKHVGQRLAERRIRRANRYALKQRGN